MQTALDFATADLNFLHGELIRALGVPTTPRRQPIWQMARSILGAQTYDEVAEPALQRLRQRWPDPARLALASPAEVLAVIHDVNHASDKAANLVAAFKWIGRERPDFDLSFLRTWAVRDALSWLERLPGVGPKVAAATLNASTLRMRIFIVDSHVHRILLRFGFIGPRASAEDARNAVTAAAETFNAHDLLELFALMKKLGQEICRPFDVQCRRCPLAAQCQKKTWLGVPPTRKAA